MAEEAGACKRSFPSAFSNGWHPAGSVVFVAMLLMHEQPGCQRSPRVRRRCLLLAHASSDIRSLLCAATASRSGFLTLTHRCGKARLWEQRSARSATSRAALLQRGADARNPTATSRRKRLVSFLPARRGAAAWCAKQLVKLDDISRPLRYTRQGKKPALRDETNLFLAAAAS